MSYDLHMWGAKEFLMGSKFAYETKLCENDHLKARGN